MHAQSSNLWFVCIYSACLNTDLREIFGSLSTSTLILTDNDFGKNFVNDWGTFGVNECPFPTVPTIPEITTTPVDITTDSAVTSPTTGTSPSPTETTGVSPSSTEGPSPSSTGTTGVSPSSTETTSPGGAPQLQPTIISSAVMFVILTYIIHLL